MKKSGYWAGAGFCLLSILCLSLSLVPLVRAYFYKPIAVTMPGQTKIDAKLPGTYIGITSFTGRTPEDRIKAMNMDYWFSDSSEKEFYKVNKFPSKNYYSEKEEAQAPLFELIVGKAGKYVFTSDYAIGTEGPSFQTVLIHYDAEHIRSELVIGLLMCVLTGALGGFLIWKTRRSSAS